MSVTSAKQTGSNKSSAKPAERNARGPEISEELIARRAYELWQRRGCPQGDGADDWDQACRQLQAEAMAARANKATAGRSSQDPTDNRSVQARGVDAGLRQGRGPILRLWDRLRRFAA